MIINPSDHRPQAEEKKEKDATKSVQTGLLVAGGITAAVVLFLGQTATCGTATLFFGGQTLAKIWRRKWDRYLVASGTAFALSLAGLVNAAHHSYWAQAYFAKAYARHDALSKIGQGRNDGEGRKEFTYQPVMGWWRSKSDSFKVSMTVVEEQAGVQKIAVRENGQAKESEFYTTLGDRMYRIRLVDGVCSRRKPAIALP